MNISWSGTILAGAVLLTLSVASASAHHRAGHVQESETPPPVVMSRKSTPEAASRLSRL
jgi:hypothetical protein